MAETEQYIMTFNPPKNEQDQIKVPGVEPNEPVRSMGDHPSELGVLDGSAIGAGIVCGAASGVALGFTIGPVAIVIFAIVGGILGGIVGYKLATWLDPDGGRK